MLVFDETIIWSGDPCLVSYFSGSVLQADDPVINLLSTSWCPSSSPQCAPWRGVQSAEVIPLGCCMVTPLIAEVWIHGSLSSVPFPHPCPHHHGQDLARKAAAKQKHPWCSLVCATHLCALFTPCIYRDKAERPACVVQV